MKQSVCYLFIKWIYWSIKLLIHDWLVRQIVCKHLARSSEASSYLSPLANTPLPPPSHQSNPIGLPSWGKVRKHQRSFRNEFFSWGSKGIDWSQNLLRCFEQKHLNIQTIPFCANIGMPIDAKCHRSEELHLSPNYLFQGFLPKKWSEAFEPRDFFEKRVGFVKYHSHDEILNVNLKVWIVIILQNNQL